MNKSFKFQDGDDIILNGRQYWIVCLTGYKPSYSPDPPGTPVRRLETFTTKIIARITPGPGLIKRLNQDKLMKALGVD